MPVVTVLGDHPVAFAMKIMRRITYYPWKKKEKAKR